MAAKLQSVWSLFTGGPRRPVMLLALTLASAAVALGLVTLSARRTYHALEAASAQRQTAYEFLMALRLLRQHVGEVRVGLTGYVITRDSAYRATYEGGIAGIGSDTVTLRALAGGEAALGPHLDRLGPAVAAYADAMAATRRAVERAPASALGAALRNARGVVLLEGVRDIIVALEREQGRLMELGAQEVTEAVRRSRAIITWVLVLGMVLILGSGGAVLAQLLGRERAERALQDREQRLSSIYDTVGDIIFYLAVEEKGVYRFISVNQAFRSVTGLDYDQVVGKPVNEVIPEPSLTVVLEKYAKAIREKSIVRWEETSEYPTGRLTGEVSVAPVFDDAGNCTHLVGAVHDITERKRTEEEIRQLNANLEAHVAERTTQLEAANRELEAFAYSVSHDLQAPLRAIDGFSRAVLDDFADTLDPTAKEHLHRVSSAAKRMAELIEDLLQLSRVGRAELSRSRTSLSEIARAVVADLQKADRDRQVDVKVQDGLLADADPRLVRVVLENLLANSWKFTAKVPRARIEFTSEETGTETVLLVRDNGAGFDMTYADRLFQPFQRLHGSADFPGTGIGLATVRRIVDRHGGRVWAEGTVGGGATFYFTIPPAGSQGRSGLRGRPA